MIYAAMTDVPAAHGPALDEAIRRFMDTGTSAHSPDGVLLAPLLCWLEERQVPFALRYMPGVGYIVKRASLSPKEGVTIVQAGTPTPGGVL